MGAGRTCVRARLCRFWTSFTTVSDICSNFWDITVINYCKPTLETGPLEHKFIIVSNDLIKFIICFVNLIIIVSQEFNFHLFSLITFASERDVTKDQKISREKKNTHI